MDDVDLAKQCICSYYCFLRKSSKWLTEVIFCESLEVYSINSYIVYKLEKIYRNERPTTHLWYIKALVDQLKGDFYQTRYRDFDISIPSFNEICLNEKLCVILTGTKKDCNLFWTKCARRKTWNDEFVTNALQITQKTNTKQILFFKMQIYIKLQYISYNFYSYINSFWSSCIVRSLANLHQNRLELLVASNEKIV